MITTQDKELLAKKGITEEQIVEQLACFQTGFPFLKLDAAASIEKGILAPDAEEQKAKKKAKKEVAIQLYSVRDILNKVDNKNGKCDPTYTALLKKLANMGYTGVEAANYNNGKFYDRTPQQFKKDVESAGLKVLSSHCTRQLSKEELASGDLSESLQWWDQCIADHKAAGMKYIVAPWMDVPKTLKELDTCLLYTSPSPRD